MERTRGGGTFPFMNRREMVQVALATAAAHTVITNLACSAAPKDAKAAPAADPHAGHNPPAAAPAAGSTSVEQKALAQAAADCVVVGSACLAHCLRDLATGSTMMKDCAAAVSQMLPLCEAMTKLAAQGSKHAAALAPLCKTACQECADACRPHAGHHDECAACLAACEATIAKLG